MSVQKLRLKHGWSQQQLADAAGLSVRTVQRIEAGYCASTETLKSLAAVFEVDFSTLNPEPNMNSTTLSVTQQQETDAFTFVRKLRDFYMRLFRYALITPVLLAINFTVTPSRTWALWIVGGWGLALLVNASRVFRPDWFLGPQWERKQVERRLGRPL